MHALQKKEPPLYIPYCQTGKSNNEGMQQLWRLLKNKSKNKRSSPLSFTIGAYFLACKYLKTIVFLRKDLNILFMAAEHKFSAHYNCIKLCFIFYESTPGKQTYNVDLMSATLIYLLRFFYIFFFFTPQVKRTEFTIFFFYIYCLSNLNVSSSSQLKRRKKGVILFVAPFKETSPILLNIMAHHQTASKLT